MTDKEFLDIPEFLQQDAREKRAKGSASNSTGLLCCPYCGNEAEYFKGTDGQADAIYCTECPLGVENSGMTYTALATVWNGLPRAT